MYFYYEQCTRFENLHEYAAALGPFYKIVDSTQAVSVPVERKNEGAL